jgi:hypothetical protein
MTFTVTSPGPNTVQITASNAGATAGTLNLFKGASGFMKKVENAITGVAPVATTGWTLYDTVSTQAIASVTYDLPWIKQVYRSLNADGVTYKYIILKWDLDKMQLRSSVCENWDLVNHVPVNECWTFSDCATVPFKMDSTDFLIFVNPRWLAFQSYINGESTNWMGCFETAREDVADTAAANYPCFGWVSSTLMNIGAVSLSAKPIGNSDHTLISFPRTRGGATGVNAAKGWAGDFGAAQYPHWLATTGAAFSYYLGSAINKFVANTWDTTKRLVLPIKPIHDYAATYISNYGQIYGLKLLSPAGENMNKIKINTDAVGNYDPTGTLTDHWLLNLHYRSPNDTTTVGWSANPDWGVTNVTIGASNRTTQAMSTGRFYYAICETLAKVVKIDAINSSTTDILTGGVYNDIDFDGERYIYVATSTGLTRIDTLDDTTTLLAITNGAFTLEITADAIWTAPAAASATPVLTRVNKSTFVADATVYTLTTFVEAVILRDSCMDAKGAVYFAPTVATAGNFKVVKVSANSVISYSTFSQVAAAAPALIPVDEDNLLLCQCVSSSTFYRTQFLASTFTIPAGGSTLTANSCSSLDVTRRASWARIDGTIYVAPPPGGATNYLFACPIAQSITAIYAAPVVLGDMNNVLHASGARGWIHSDGARILGGTDQGLRVFTKIHTTKPITNTTIGQMALIS